MRKLRRRAATAVLAAAALAGAPRKAHAAPPPVTLELAESSGAYTVQGRIAVAAPPALVWEVLTDYGGMGAFVSSIRTSRVLSRQPGRALIEQVGSGRFLFFTKAVKLTLSVVEQKPLRIAFKDEEGTQFRRYEGSWDITETPEGSLLVYTLEAEPDPALGPRFAARRVLAKNAQKLLGEVRAEIARRAGDAS